MNLDFSVGPQTRADRTAEALRARLAALLTVEPGQILVSLAEPLVSTARALEIALTDVRELGPAAFAATRPSGPVLYQPTSEALGLVALDCASLPVAASLKHAVAAPPEPLLQRALSSLTPAALLKAAADRDTLTKHLSLLADFFRSRSGVGAVSGEAAALVLQADDAAVLAAELDGLGLVANRKDSEFRLHFSGVADAARLIEYLGVRAGHRRASVRRTTKETDIALTVDLDGDGAQVATGVHFFDHMLEQIARHAGIGLQVRCEGDIEVDAHHTVEDVCLALGEALREALGDKTGIGRFGFALPMDETRASVWIDLSGRPFFRFDGAIPGERVGDMPVEMAPHAFRSLAESMKASIHVEVDGENAHHMIEGCFKAFGRALRQAVRIEDDALPSTKGVL